MKITYVGFALLFTLVLAYTASGSHSSDPESRQASQQSEQASGGQVTNSESSSSDRGGTILSRSEADSLRAQGDSLFAQSRVGDIKVGSSGGTGLIYILVVVILVLVILKIAL